MEGDSLADSGKDGLRTGSWPWVTPTARYTTSRRPSPLFSNPAVSPWTDPSLCVTAPRLVCLYRRGVRDNLFISILNTHASRVPEKRLKGAPSRAGVLPSFLGAH